MKRLFCIFNPSPDLLSAVPRVHGSVSTDDTPPKPHVFGFKRPPMMQVTIEVVKSEFGRNRLTRTPKGGEPHNLTPIQYAALKGRDAALIHYLRAGQSPDDGSETGQSPLCIATSAGHVSVVRMLLEAGANINAATKPEGETALHIAIKQGRSDIVDLLLPYTTDFETRTTFTGETPLHYAAKVGSLATVVGFLKKGANYTALNNSNQSPAEVAFEAKHVHVAVAIISAARGKRTLRKEKEMLLQYVEKAQNRYSMNNELIADIFEAGCDPDSTVLVEAIKKEDISLAEMFLEKGADPNRATAKGVLPIRLAIKCPSADMVRLLVKYKVDVTVKGSNGFNLLQLLLSKPRVQEKQVLTDMFESLFHGGADPGARYSDGKTLLHHAVSPEFQLAKVARMLIEAGVKVNAQDNAGCAALHAAFRDRSCVDVLLKNGADPNLMNYDNLTPLLYALTTSQNDAELDLDLLIRVSNLQTMAPNRKLPLHLAAENGLDRAVRTLLRYRPSTTVTDSEGLTPLLLAVRNHNWVVVSLLASMPGVNAWDKDGNTALHNVVTSTPTPPSTWEDIALAAGKFCEKGVSRSMRNKSGATPLIAAIQTLGEEGLPVVEVLLKETGPARSNCVSHEDHKQRSALYFAVTLGKYAFVSALLRHGVAVNIREWTENHVLKPSDPDHAKILKMFAEHEWIRRGRILQRSSMSPQSILPRLLPKDDLVLLLSMGLDPNALPDVAGPSLLWVVIKQLRLQNPPPYEYMASMVQVLLAAGADPNVLCATSPPPMPAVHPLTFILQHAPKIDLDLIELLLKNGAKLSTLNTEPCPTPLHAAVAANRLDVVDEFLTRGVGLNAVDDKGRTALFIAAQRGLWEILNWLLRSGADLHIQSNLGDTCLHVGVAAGSYEVVKSLLTKRAKVFVENKNGEKPIELIPENLDEKEKERMMSILQDAERRQDRGEDVSRRDRDWEQERERERAKMEQERMKRKEVERIQREQREKERTEWQQKERERRARDEKERESLLREESKGMDKRFSQHRNGLTKQTSTPALSPFSKQQRKPDTTPSPPPSSRPQSRVPFRSVSAQQLQPLPGQRSPRRPKSPAPAPPPSVPEQEATGPVSTPGPRKPVSVPASTPSPSSRKPVSVPVKNPSPPRQLVSAPAVAPVKNSSPPRQQAPAPAPASIPKPAPTPTPAPVTQPAPQSKPQPQPQLQPPTQKALPTPSPIPAPPTPSTTTTISHKPPPPPSPQSQPTSPPKSRRFSFSFLTRTKNKNKSSLTKPSTDSLPKPPTLLSLSFQSQSARASRSHIPPGTPTTPTPINGAVAGAGNGQEKEKPLPRIDSVYAGLANGAPVVPPKEEKRVEKKRSDDGMASELEGWLAVSKMLDRL